MSTGSIVGEFELSRLVRLKFDLWDREMGSTLINDQVAEAQRDVRAARELLNNIRISLDPKVRRLGLADDDPRLPPPGWSFIPAAHLDYVHAAMSDYLGGNSSLDESFGVKRGAGRPRLWSDYEERMIAGVPYKIMMLRRHWGEPEDKESAMTEGAKAVDRFARSNKSTLYRVGADITTSHLWKLYSRWKDRLVEIEERVEKTAQHLIDRHGTEAENMVDFQ